MDNATNKEILDFLMERFKIEREKFDRSGVYAFTQRLLAIIQIRLRGVHLLRNRQHLCLTMVHFQNQMIITEQRMLRK